MFYKLARIFNELPFGSLYRFPVHVVALFLMVSSTRLHLYYECHYSRHVSIDHGNGPNYPHLIALVSPYCIVPLQIVLLFSDDIIPKERERLCTPSCRGIVNSKQPTPKMISFLRLTHFLTIIFLLM